jgi:DNA primase
VNARAIADQIPMVRLLTALGFEVSGRTRRCACIVHGGKNQSAFTWRDDGRWYCYSCGQGGDRIALVRAARNCGFREAMDFLGQLVGVKYLPRRASCYEIERARIIHERAEKAAWRVSDEVIRLRSYYRDGLHRAERLAARVGEEILCSSTEDQREGAWERLARLAAVQSFFLAAYDFTYRIPSAVLVRFALASPEQRRTLIFGDDDGISKLQAA